MAADDVLQRRRGEEILLAQPQFLSGRSGVGGVEHAGDRVGPGQVGERAGIIAAIEGLEADRVGRLRAPQAKRVHPPAAPADDRRIEGDRENLLLRIPELRAGVVAGSPASTLPPKPIS